MSYIIFTSGGNDSVALIQWGVENLTGDVVVSYSNTGWESSYWPRRIKILKQWVEGLGFPFIEIKSEGMENLVERKKAWPRGGGGKFQFCTKALKEEPAMAWMGEFDPNCEYTCMIGVRREEGRNRHDHPEYTLDSEKHGGRELWAPLVRHTEAIRNELLSKTPFKPLPYRSKECYPCVNANKGELRRLDEETICKVEVREAKAGINSKGNPRVMFSPKRHNGAIGIRAVVHDAKKENEDLFETVICSSGWCD